MTMVAVQVMGNNTTVSVAVSQWLKELEKYFLLDEFEEG
jgi:fumarate hydratase class II